MAVLHKIKALLYRNPLTSDPDDYIIRPVSERTLEIREICESSVSRGGADVSAPAMEHAVILFLKEMGYQLCNGFSINTGWFMARPQIRGVAKGAHAQYDENKHTLLFEFLQGAVLRRELKNVTVEILGVAGSGATIGQVTDIKTGSVNNLLTPNRNLRIAGAKIKIAGDNAVNGVYFVNTATAETVKVDESDIVINNPSEVMIIIPALDTGTYRIEVTTQYSSNLLKESQTAIFDKDLTVE